MDDGANRTPLGDVSNTRGKRAYQLLPGKITIRPDTVENGPVVMKRARKGSGEENTRDAPPSWSVDSGSWKTWTLMEPNKDPPQLSLQPHEEDVVDAFRARDDTGCVTSRDQKRGEFSSASLYPTAPSVEGGFLARADTGSKLASRATTLLHEEAENACSADGVVGVGELMGACRNTGCNQDAQGACHSRLFSTNQEDDVACSGNQKTLDLLDNSRVKTDAEARVSSDGMALDLEEGIEKEAEACDRNCTVDAGASVGSKGPCSCQICAKASWLLADVLYQDYRGRLSEVKKSRKAAGIFVGRSFVRDSTRHGSEKFTEFTKLEYDMMQRWRSLFLHTENALLREGTHLQESIFKLNELKTKCERDLELKNLFSASHNPASHDPD